MVHETFLSRGCLLRHSRKVKRQLRSTRRKKNSSALDGTGVKAFEKYLLELAKLPCHFDRLLQVSFRIFECHVDGSVAESGSGVVQTELFANLRGSRMPQPVWAPTFNLCLVTGTMHNSTVGVVGIGPGLHPPRPRFASIATAKRCRSTIVQLHVTLPL